MKAELPTCCIVHKFIKFGSWTSLLGLFFMFPCNVTVKLWFPSCFLFTSLLSSGLAPFVIFFPRFCNQVSPSLCFSPSLLSLGLAQFTSAFPDSIRSRGPHQESSNPDLRLFPALKRKEGISCKPFFSPLWPVPDTHWSHSKGDVLSEISPVRSHLTLSLSQYPRILVRKNWNIWKLVPHLC